MDFSHFSCAVYQQTKDGRTQCGDNYYMLEKDDCLIVAIADGLGSGDHAYNASIKATNILQLHDEKTPFQLISLSNSVLYQTRGVVISIIKINYKEQSLRYCGVGNIHFAIYPQGNKRLRPLSKPGYLDGRPIDVREWIFPFHTGDKFIMYSDGIDFRHDVEPIVRLTMDPYNSLEELIIHLTPLNDDATLIIGG